MKNHRFPWLRNRTTDNRKCEKARNIKEKCTIEMFSTVSKLLVEHHSSQNVNYTFRNVQFQKRFFDSSGLRSWGVFDVNLCQQ